MFGLGSTAQLGIGIAISLNNRFSGQAAKVNRDLKAMRENSMSLAQSAVRDYRNTATNIAATAAATSYGIFRLTEAHSEFQHKINQVYIVGGKEIGKSRKQLEEFARDFSHQFTRTPTEIAGAMFENVKAGVNSNIDEVTRYQIAVATATDEMLDGEEGVAAKLLGITNAMGLPLSQFARVANATTAAANASMASVRSIGESMEYAAFTAHTFNIPLEQTLALVAKLSQAKITGSAGGTALNNFLTQLSKNTGPFMGKKAGAAWRMLGLDPNDISNTLNKGDIFGVVEALDSAAARLPNSLKKSAFQQLFNIRGDRGLEALLESMGSGDPKKSIRGLYDDVKKGVQSDIAMQQSRDMQNDVYSDIKFLRNSFYELGIAFVKAVTPIMRVGLPVITKGVQLFAKLTESPIGTFVGSIVAVVSPLVALRFGLRALNLTIAMALRTLGLSTAAGGYSGLASAAWNMAGLSLFKGAKTQLPPGVALNSAGKLYVGAGQSVNFGGKTYGGGRILPNAYGQSIGFNPTNIGRGQAIGSLLGASAGFAGLMGSSGAASGTGAIGSMLSKVAGSGLGRLVGVGLRFLPGLGLIYSIYEILRMMWGESKTEKVKERDPIADSLRNDLYQKAFGQIMDPGMAGFSKQFQLASGRKPFTIVLNNYMNGQLQGTQQINSTMDNDIAKNLHSNLFGN